MVIYGTKITSDIDFYIETISDIEIRFELNLTSNIPLHLKELITCGFRLYESHGRTVYLHSDREFLGSEQGQPWCYNVEDLITFYWFGGESTIYYELDKKADAYLLGFWFIHLLFPLYMSLENKYDFLHAGAVEVREKPILFIAPSMGGKSTLTDYFLQQGHSLISDDKVATYIDSGNFMTVGSVPYHRPYRRFEDLGYYAKNFMKDSKPIHVMYELCKSESSVPVMIEEIKGFEKFNTLLPNYLYVFPWLKAERFKHLSQMLNTVKVFRVTVPWDLERLDEVYEAICTHTNSLT